MNYLNRTVTGYWIGYNNNGTAAIMKVTDLDFMSNDRKGQMLCDVVTQVNANGFNTIRVESRDFEISYFLNDKLACRIKDSFGAGSMGTLMVGTFTPPDSPQGHTFDVDSVELETSSDSQTRPISSTFPSSAPASAAAPETLTP